VYLCLDLSNSPPLFTLNFATATVTLRSLSPRLSFTTATYTALLQLRLCLLRVLPPFRVLSADSSLFPPLVDYDRNTSERPQLLIDRNRLVHHERCAMFTASSSHCVPLCPVP
jgi:hypothetical protein